MKVSISLPTADIRLRYTQFTYDPFYPDCRNLTGPIPTFREELINIRVAYATDADFFAVDVCVEWHGTNNANAA
jgi:hypothetical protein